jgi:DNA-binding MarR family transcriptional regulator
VQRIVNDRAQDGLVRLEANPRYRRAQLVVLTDEGGQAFDAAMSLQAPWVNRLSDGLTVNEINAADRAITKLQTKLDGMTEADDLD